MSIRTRFAPSPTGYLHIGGVRTALFNWLFAKQNQGQFVLRIDDTDQERNVESALQPILDGFRWLGIDWDEGPEIGGPFGPYFQSERGDLYRAAAEQLLEKGLAYRDYATADELKMEREAAEKEKRNYVPTRNWMAGNDAQAKAFEAEGRSAVVRLKMPREGKCIFHDEVRGKVEVEWANESDHVIQRADGTCLYHLASVVDDNAFAISHVIRAVEHLSNTPRQIFIAEGLGYDLPTFAHLPFVAEPGSKNKLSKRKIENYFKNRDFKKLYDRAASIADKIGVETTPATFNPVLVDFYRVAGFLPEAINNYLLLLGWSLDDHTETFSRQEMIEKFSLERVVKAPASFDPAKLQAFQKRYFNELSDSLKLENSIPFLSQAHQVQTDNPEVLKRLAQIVQAAGDRLEVAGDILDYKDLLETGPILEYEEKAFTKRIVKPAEALPLLAKLKNRLAEDQTFSAESTHDFVHQFVEAEQIKIGQIIHALRVATTGKGVGVGMFETLEILGKSNVLARIDQTIAKANTTSSNDQGATSAS